MKLLRTLVFAGLLGLGAGLAQAESGPLDLNKASAEQLADALYGVGLTKAQAIVAWRAEHGPFTSIDQLAEVKGIGPALVERNRDRVIAGNGQ